MIEWAEAKLETHRKRLDRMPAEEVVEAAFAARYGLDLRTLQDWEQRRTHPDTPARAFLLVIDREPRAVERALAVATTPVDAVDD